jgi:hypothetical protein
MNRQDAITRLCNLTSEVGEKVFKNEKAHDCFCMFSHDYSKADVAEDVVAFIEKVIRQGIKDYNQEAK